MALTLRARGLRMLVALGLASALLVPAAAPVVAQDDLTLRVGTTQDLDSMNPWQTALVVGFEVFTLNYQLLVGFGPDLQPEPDFASEWTQSDDGLTWTFKMQPGNTWSDGTPATAEDAAWTYQLILDAFANEDYGGVCLSYLDYYLDNAGVTEVRAVDAETFEVVTDRPNDQILRTYIPILPKHIWELQTLDTICEYTNDPPVVGSGPYQAQEWQTGQFVRFAKNPNYVKPNGAAETIVIQIFGDSGTMAAALQSGELDYAQGVNPDQFDQLTGQADIQTVAADANGWTQLGFNTYGTGTGNVIEGGGPSTKALLDAAFRDALGYAVDQDLLVERVLSGYGTPGTTNVPPFQTAWHVDPDNPRTFDLEMAKQKLEAAGYTLDANGNRLDKEGNPIQLRLVMPDSDEVYPNSAQFITDWWKELGISITSQVFDSGTLVDLMLPPEAGDEYKADYDLFIWGWAGDVDPSSLLDIFTCRAIGGSSDSLYCNPDYDALFEDQNVATSNEERKATIAEMQNLIYDEAPYHILFYDATLAAYRTDRFAGWQNQPTANGAPLFGYGPLGYTLLTDATAQPSPEPSAAASGEPGASAAPSATPGDGDGTGGGGDNTLLIVGLVAIAAIVVIGLVYIARQRSKTAAGSDEEE